MLRVLISHSLRPHYPSSCSPHLLLRSPALMPFFVLYICLMFPVFVTRLYWLFSTVIPALFLTISLFHSPVSVLFCLIYFLVSVFSISGPGSEPSPVTDYASSLPSLYHSPVLFGLDPRLPTGPAHTCLLALDFWTVHYSFGLINHCIFPELWSGDWFLSVNPDTPYMCHYNYSSVIYFMCLVYVYV